MTRPVAALTDALRSEARLLAELMALMQRQREAVATDDLETVEDSVYGIHRVLNTLNQARVRRRSINRTLGESDDLSLQALESVLGPTMPAELREVRDELEVLARTLSNEVDITRRVLRQALASGDEYVRSLCEAIEPKAGYPRGTPGAAERSGAILLDRLA